MSATPEDSSFSSYASDARRTDVAPDARSVLSELESADRLLIQQVFRPIGNEYRISIPAPGSSEEGRPVLFVKDRKSFV